MPTFGQVSAPKSLADGRSISAYNPEEKHRAYLQRLQERNQVQRQQQQDETTQEKLRREQGFNVCFSGANAAQRQWEEATVEIKGIGGETQKVPTGTEEDAAEEETEEIPEELPEEDAPHLQASTQPQLALEQTQKAGDASPCDPSPAEGYRDMIAPEQLAQRISSLPSNWQRALMDLLEKAEAEVQASLAPIGLDTAEEQGGGSTSFAPEPAVSSRKPIAEDNETPRSGGPENSPAEAVEADREALPEPAPVTPPTQSKDPPTAAGGGTAAVRAVRAACASDLSTDAPDDD
ncbi:hypothetical protein AK812_SmicGene12360 [Symbiodinium microadriaticum]|uniref:Uncharacterized protein n=1 Tax=Symbiodinium microadriaticum TaxID=2951 RepID=A0A1Q9EAU3_SYMMI|nr:hypothetical protein AK812_SmicGene12360 [Symbiodinium microadriaticum]